jgi:hypothetical protein
MDPFKEDMLIWVQKRGVCRVTHPKCGQSEVHLACVLNKGTVHRIPHGRLLSQSVVWSKINETSEAIAAIKKTLRQTPASRIPDEAQLCRRLTEYDPKLWATIIRDLRRISGLNDGQTQAKEQAEKYLVGWVMAILRCEKTVAEVELGFVEQTVALQEGRNTVTKPRTSTSIVQTRPTEARQGNHAVPQDARKPSGGGIGGTQTVPVNPAQPAVPPGAGPEQTTAGTQVSVGPTAPPTRLPPPTEATETVTPAEKPSWRERIAKAIKVLRAKDEAQHELLSALQQRVTELEAQVLALQQSHVATPPTTRPDTDPPIEELVIGQPQLPKLKGAERKADGYWVFGKKNKPTKKKH